VARCLRRVRRRGDPGKRWLAFLRNHREVIVAFDYFSVPKVASKSMWRAVPPRRFRELFDGMAWLTPRQVGTPRQFTLYVMLHLAADPVLTTHRLGVY